MAYIDKYGVEFSDDRKTLVRCPEDFEGCYIIHSEVNIIGENAFANCNLQEIYIPDSVTDIADGAFAGCSLRNVYIPGSVVKIGKGAFAENFWLSSVVLSDGIEIIGERAFSSSESYGNLDLLEIPFTIKEIGKESFRRYNYHEEDFYAVGGRVIEHYAAYTSEADNIDTLIIAADLDVFWSELVGKKYRNGHSQGRYYHNPEIWVQ